MAPAVYSLHAGGPGYAALARDTALYSRLEQRQCNRRKVVRRHTRETEVLALLPGNNGGPENRAPILFDRQARMQVS